MCLMGLIVSCDEKEENASPVICGVENPIENLSWLKEKIDTFSKTTGVGIQIFQATYQNETVFIVDDCMNCADALIQVYNCQGDVICQLGGFAGLNTCPDFDKEVSNQELIWTNSQ